MNNVSQPAFEPAPGQTVSIAATTVSANVQNLLGRLARHVRIFNSGTVTVFVEFGSSAVTASATTSMPVAPGAFGIFSAPANYYAAVTASGTATVYFTPGEGM